jgi:hypothetical protein
MRWRRRGILALVLCGAGHPLAAQRLDLQGYALNVLLAADSGDFGPGGVQDFQRLRLMASPTFGRVALDLAYEQLLTVRSNANLATLGQNLGEPAGGGAWLPLQGTLEQGAHALWRHRVDRLSVTVNAGPAEVSVGRQPISWATTLFLTPADPFSPFDPTDPFREYRTGVDAARVRLFPSAMSELDAVVRPATFGSDSTLTALGRGRVAFGRFEVSGWGGVLYDEGAGALAATVTLAGAVVRTEGTLRRTNGTSVMRLAVGADRSFNVAGRALYLVVEYQHDGFGAADAAGLVGTITSAPYQRAELQVFGRDEVALQSTYQIHPLVSLEALGLWNAGDGSVLAAPAVSWNALTEVGIRGGVFLGFGNGATAAGFPGSEYGSVPRTGYVAGTVFF